jgi:hypothetical protein
LKSKQDNSENISKEESDRLEQLEEAKKAWNFTIGDQPNTSEDADKNDSSSAEWGANQADSSETEIDPPATE